MSLVVKEKVYENANEGLHNAKIVRIDDLGLVESVYGTKDKVRIVFQTEQKAKDGTLIEVSPRFTKSLHEKSALAKFLKSMKITAKGSFDLNDLVGTKIQIVVSHTEKDGKTYANIDSFLPIKKAGTKAPTSPPAEEEVEEEAEVETDEI